MTRPAPSNDSRHARRVIVTLVITTAAAAVTAGVALQKHPHGAAIMPAADASTQVVGGIAATAMSSSDLSLPAAGEALQRSDDTASQSAQTF